ncbi:MAG: bifunctional folylpolyglutamate synthase/dihydrofolate synthase [Gammaproteobacteria bacterium]|nr:bifunctional folylpolyglutamate synthase/dihydrofolate synthase [Gammaproteobacteria bacterium]
MSRFIPLMCHPERSEGSPFDERGANQREVPRCARDDVRVKGMMLDVKMTLADWLHHLESRFRHAPIKLGLERMADFAARLAVDSLPCVVITVAGTNGKGSTVRALEAMYLAAGYQVGAYTSPHLLVFNERIRWNGVAISDAAWCEAFAAIAQCEGADELTYFEWTTLAALYFFKTQRPDVVILEVGMGGRLDATNVIDADLAIITTIDFDHEAYLGQTLDAIGYEKAGILRAGRPFIFASKMVPDSVVEVAKTLGAKGVYAGRDYHYDITPWAFHFHTQTLNWTATLPQLHPEAVSAALMATCLLKDRLPIEETAWHAAITARVPGRLQVLPSDIVVDVAHNPQSVRRLSQWLKDRYPDRAIHAVFSALEDKAISSMVATLNAQVTTWHVAPLEGERAATQEQLRDAFSLFPSSPILWYNDVFSAFTSAKRTRETGELVVVFGSFLTVSAVLQGGSYEINDR